MSTRESTLSAETISTMSDQLNSALASIECVIGMTRHIMSAAEMPYAHFATAATLLLERVDADIELVDRTLHAARSGKTEPAT